MNEITPVGSLEDLYNRNSSDSDIYDISESDDSYRPSDDCDDDDDSDYE